MTTRPSPPPQWSRRRAEKQRRLDQVRNLADGVVLPSERIVEALEPPATAWCSKAGPLKVAAEWKLPTNSRANWKN